MVEFVIVPVEPDENMLGATFYHRGLSRTYWKAMINARPKLPEGDITPAMERVLCIIAKWLNERGQVPTYREIMRDLGLRSTGNVSSCIERLCQRGYLTRVPGRTRTIRFTERAQGRFKLGETPMALNDADDGAGMVGDQPQGS